MTSRKIVVITPVKNEEWILDQFLTAASGFADHIIISDHSSTDSSVAIAEAFEKVKVIHSLHSKYAEAERRNELLIAARTYGSGNLILAIDADEILSPEFFSKDFMETLVNQEIGTRFEVPLWNIKPDFQEFWTPGFTPFGFVDDGSLHDTSNMIHFPRIPPRRDGASQKLFQQALLHLQFINWERMESKHRWYKVWETLNFPSKSAVDIYRRYDHMNIIPSKDIKTFPKEWLLEYLNRGIDLASLQTSLASYWWDDEVLNLFQENDEKQFRYLGMEKFLNLNNLHLQNSRDLKVVTFWKYIDLTAPLHNRSHIWQLRIGLRLLDKLIGWIF